MAEQLTLDSLMEKVEKVKCKDTIPLSVKSYIWSREKVYKAYLKGLYDLAAHMSKFKKEIITDYGNNINVNTYIQHLKERKGDATKTFINEVERYILNNFNFSVVSSEGFTTRFSFLDEIIQSGEYHNSIQ